MKLSKVYAEGCPFHNIEFKEGFNVVLGQISERIDRKKNTHNLGKSSLIIIIDFLLLKESIQLFKDLKDISKYVFFLEIQLNNSKFLIVKRAVNNQSKISFKLNNDRLEGFITNIWWDKENVPIKKAKQILNDYLCYDIAVGLSYRKTVSYFLRAQNDYADVFQLSKFKQGKDREWKPFLFELLGFDRELLLKKYEYDDKKKDLENLIKQFKNTFAINTDEGDKLKGAIEIKKGEKENIASKIDVFNFYFNDKEINRQLIENIDAQINILSTKRYSISYEIDKIENSLKSVLPQIDIDEIKSLYEEVKLFFPDNLINDYKKLEEFNKSISRERQKYLAERLIELKKEFKNIDKELQFQEKEKSKKLSVLKNYDSYEKFKYYQKELAQIDSDIARLEEKFANLNKVEEIEKQLKAIKNAIEEFKEKIKIEILSDNRFYKKIRKTFNEIISTILDVPAILSISQNDNGNIEFHTDIQNPNKIETTAEGYGTTYKKLLCMAFDLSILITYSQNSFYKFVFHDGVFEGLDDRIKINFINLIRDICREHNLQYILTVIDSDIPINEDEKKIAFYNEEIALTLHDRDATGRLFKQKF
ncbi:MAG: DUF2326 domain-containing protein [Candidatus Magnetoovum sp. WYHC-5]|nr:DUF2326 domain-containing protein [Candidatus Magnetoovum sp. WYHC-5]